jgi:hypothetical protein
MPRPIKISPSLGAVLLLLFAGHTGKAQEVQKTDATVSASQTFALTDPKDLLVEPGVKAEAVEYRGRKAVRLTREAVDQAGVAFVTGTDFRDGTIEVDIATKVTTPPGGRRPGFIGVAFRAAYRGLLPRAFVHCTHAQTIHPDRKNLAPRLSPEP